MSTLKVYWDDNPVGRLSQVSKLEMWFQYSADYLASEQARPISLSLPLQSEAFSSALSRAWFANLLPEGEVRGHVARKLGVSERNDFALLDGIGGDCAGALRLLPESAPLTKEGKLVPLPWNELEAKIASSPRPSLMALVLQDGELRLSLAGAQDKLPVHLDGMELALPAGNAASTHLLKISRGDFPDLVQNELFCLRLAAKVGLNIPHAEMAETRTPILLVERYDRLRQPDGSVSRLHQEDFCQALGFPPESKYENEGGPSLAQVFAALSRGSRRPLPDKRDLIGWVIFNFLLGNADAHAKNISFLFGGPDDTKGPRLAPFYDLVCTQVYGHLSTRQAQKIGGEYRYKNILGRHWNRFADAIGVKPRYLRSLGLELCEKVQESAPALAGEIGSAHGGQATLNQIMGVMEGRAERLRRQLGG